MNRRDVLRGAGVAMTASLAGCLETVDELSTRFGGGCPSRDIEELSYESQRSSRDIIGFEQGIRLATAADHAEKFDREFRFIRETDFETSVIVGVQAISSVSSDAFEISAVGLEDESTIHVFTCIPDSSRSDVAYTHARLLRIPREEVGSTVQRAFLTHWNDGTESTHEDEV
ncbi:hypothetical protein OB905_11520 [Halobacteria archaeon AArc-dxtr1]|nr:hypothetical protein [Halobacteria archaeon AArc-dxtr1]